MIKISVIIPVYNVEQYLPKCLDSVLNQTLKDIEIICINDESPDNCAQILEEYQKRDSRIIILNQKNSGQGSARNRGLEIAKGKYIQFLDSDDFYEPTCCEEMYNLMEQHKDIDVACFDCNIIYDAYEDKKEIDANYFRMHFTGKTKVKPSMAHQLVDVNCWNKIFRKSFLDKYKLYFPEKLHYEDVGFFGFWITKVSYIYFYQKKLTNYLRRKGSFLGEIYEKSSKTIFDAFKVNELIYDDLVKNNKWHEYKSVFIQAYLLKIKWLINCFSKEQYQNRKKLIDICSAFLSQFDVKNFNLNDNELCCYESIINKNYYLYDAYKKYDIEIVHPIYNNSVNIVFSADKNYIPYLSVTIQSIVSNSTLDDNYDIVILYNELYDYQKRFILSICKAHPNISIRFFNMNNFVHRYNLDNLFTVNHITISAYFRLFIGKIFSEYKRILYLDCDLVVTQNISKLFNIDIGIYPIAAALDTTISNSLITNGFNQGAWRYFKKYMYENLNFVTQKSYFNSGVMIIDIDKFNELSFDYLLDLARRNHEFFHDQNVLNAAFENNYFKLSNIWNFQWNVKFHSVNGSYKTQLPSDLLAFYEDYDIVPAIIHYTSHEKLWKNPYHTFANIWWEYARKTPFYEIFLKDLYGKSIQYIQPQINSSVDMNIIRDVANYSRNRFNYYRYKFLSKITFDKMRKHYKKKRKELKSKLKQVRKFLKGK